MLLFFDLFFEKFSKKYIGFFPGIYSLRKSFSYDCILFWSDFSALTPGIHRLARVYICVSLFGPFLPIGFRPWAGRLCGCWSPPGVAGCQADNSPVFVHFDVFLCAASCFCGVSPLSPVAFYDGHLTMFLRLLSLVFAEIHHH